MEPKQSEHFSRLAIENPKRLKYRYQSRTNRTKIETIIEFAKLQEGDRVLEIGCFMGDQCHLLQNISILFNVMGIDVAKEAVKIAKKRFNYIDFGIGDGENLPFKDDVFDVTVTIGSLHHIRNQKKTFREMIRVSKRAVIVSEPNIFNPMFLIAFFKKYKTEKHALKTNVFSLQKLFNDSLHDVQIRHVGFAPINPSYNIFQKIENIFCQIPVLKNFGVTTIICGYVKTKDPET